MSRSEMTIVLVQQPFTTWRSKNNVVTCWWDASPVRKMESTLRSERAEPAECVGRSSVPTSCYL